MVEPVTFQAYVYKVQTLVDGSLRIALDLPENATEQAYQLMEFKRWGIVGNVTYAPIGDNQSEQPKRTSLKHRGKKED